MLCMFQGLPLKYNDFYSMVFPGSEIPKWFSHQCMGDEVKIMEPFSHLCNDWIGIAVCVVFCTLPHHQYQGDSPITCKLTFHRNELHILPGEVVANALLDHIFLIFMLPQLSLKEDIKSLLEFDANGFHKIGIKIDNRPTSLVKKCGLRVVYKKDIKDLNSAMAQCSNNSIIPYIPHHNFKNSAVVVEVNKNDCKESS